MNVEFLTASKDGDMTLLFVLLGLFVSGLLLIIISTLMFRLRWNRTIVYSAKDKLPLVHRRIYSILYGTFLAVGFLAMIVAPFAHFALNGMSFDNLIKNTYSSNEELAVNSISEYKDGNRTLDLYNVRSISSPESIMVNPRNDVELSPGDNVKLSECNFLRNTYYDCSVSTVG